MDAVAALLRLAVVMDAVAALLGLADKLAKGEPVGSAVGEIYISFGESSVLFLRT